MSVNLMSGFLPGDPHRPRKTLGVVRGFRDRAKPMPLLQLQTRLHALGRKSLSLPKHLPCYVWEAVS